MANFFTTIALANHQVGLVLCRALHALGEQSEPELKKILIPNFSVTDDTQQWDKSVEALKRVKLITYTNDVLSLPKSLRDEGVIDHAVFAQEFMRGLVEVNLETIRKGEDPDDLFKAILWLATLPAGYLITRDLAQPYARLKAFGLEGLIANDEQMNIFRRWTRGLGFSREFKDCELIDFSEIVHGIIKRSVVGGPLEAFIQQLELTVPFLSNEELRTWYSSATGSQQKWSSIDEQLGWALFTAEQRGLVTFRREDDARVETISLPFDSNGGARSYTHLQKVA
jgi:hypothetical protein